MGRLLFCGHRKGYRLAGVIVLGGQWGDEGKGKIIDCLSRRAQLIVRYQGGDNAGHTVIVNGKEFVFHLVPSGIIWPDKECLIGHGVVVNPFSLIEEKNRLQGQGCSVEGRLWVSDRAHMIMPYHKEMDRFWEAYLGKQKIGTTGRGVGPAYTDKASRRGIRVGELRQFDRFARRLRENVEVKNHELSLLGEKKRLDADEILASLEACSKEILPLVTDGVERIHQALRQKKDILWEGAQGTLLDVDLGTYPYVTSSSACVGGALTGTGVGPKAIGTTIAVMKAYTTRVGEGPFPSQCSEDDGKAIREKGHEFGATTGRPRRCGWFDGVATRYATRVNGVDQLAVTKLDVLDEQQSIQVCVGYRCDGKVMKSFPSDIDILSRCEPIYESFEGWCQDTSGITRYQDLPDKAKKYLAALEGLLEVPVGLISTGPGREDLIEKRDPFQA